MALYEVVILLKTSLSEKEIEVLLDKYKGLVKKGKGKVLKEEDWGARSLAYPIQKNSRGRYILLCLDAHHSIVDNIVQEMRISEDVFRHLVVQVEEISKEPTPMMQRTEKVEDGRYQR